MQLLQCELELLSMSCPSVRILRDSNARLRSYRPLALHAKFKKLIGLMTSNVSPVEIVNQSNKIHTLIVLIECHRLQSFRLDNAVNAAMEIASIRAKYSRSILRKLLKEI
jgi:hypothetical protein